MTNSWETILNQLARIVSDAAGVAVLAEDFSPPPDAKLGDLALGCFKIAKMKGRNPAEVAKELVSKFGTGDRLVESVSAAGPYLNITLRASSIVPEIVGEIESRIPSPIFMDEGAGKRLMLEYAQPNTHKEIHVGHLRNLVLGAALEKLFVSTGWQVVAASYHGDVGAHVAKCLWWLARKNGGVEKALKGMPQEQRTGRFLGIIYAEAGKELEAHPEWKDEVSEVQRKLEAHDPEWEKLWEETKDWSVQEMTGIFTEFGIRLDRQYFESEVVDEGQRIVDELLGKDVAKMSEGAVIVDLEDEKLGVFLIRKSDGTSLYATKDLALAQLKFREYPDLERSLLVIDNRQRQYALQLFATLRRMGFAKPHEFVGYEFVTLKTGAMSSREGNIVTLESFRDELLDFAEKETAKRHPDWSREKIDATARQLAFGGMKFGMLKQDTDKVIVFDQEQALSFDGATGPYVQYAATRLGSILRKANAVGAHGHAPEGDLSKLDEPREKRLAFCLAQLPQVVAKASKELRPSLVAQWLLDAAARANEFYRDVPVLDAPAEIRSARLRLVAAAHQALGSGLALLGIGLPEEM